MTTPRLITFGAAVALTTASLAVIGFDLCHHVFEGSVLTNGLFIATGTAWIILNITRTSDALQEEMYRTRRELHTTTEVRHLKSVTTPRRDT